MKLRETALADVFLLDLDRHEDERGFFARAWCENDFTRWGLETAFVQSNISCSRKTGTLRGLHYQLEPYSETKLLRCIAGAVHDVVVDLRPGSETFMRWAGFDLEADGGTALYIPRGFANGFVSLTDDSKVFYSVDRNYQPGRERGVRFDDEAIGVLWPVKITTISEKDRNWPKLAEV